MSPRSSTPDPLRRLAAVIAVQIVSNPDLTVIHGGTESRHNPVDFITDIIHDLLVHAKCQPHYETDPCSKSEPPLQTETISLSEPQQRTDPVPRSEPRLTSDPTNQSEPSP